MKFLIELNVFPENEENFSKILTDLKIDHCFWDGESNPPYEKNDNKVFFIGKIYTALKIKQLGYSYQVWLGPEFDYSYFGSHLNNLLNDDFLMGTCSQINKIYLTDNSIPPNEMVYIRSNSGYKRFQGDLYSRDIFLMESKKHALPQEEILVLASEKEIAQEYRLVIKSKYDEISDLWEYDVITYSQYEGEKRELTNGEVRNIIQDLETSTYRPYPLFILDVCICEEKIKILEANSINTSGYYTCNLQRIVESILKIEKEEIQ